MPDSHPDRPDADGPDLNAVFAGYPDLGKRIGTVLDAIPQAGLTNRVYRLDTTTGRYFLRLPRNDTAGSIDRFWEAHNLRVAAAEGVAVPPVFVDPGTGLLVTAAVDVLEGRLAQFPFELGRLVGRLHGAGAVFKGRLDLQDVLAAQVAALSTEPDLLRRSDRLVALLGKTIEGAGNPEAHLRLVPSHGDLSAGNCLSGPDRVWLIDWEYSAMADPAWDLAYAIVEHDFCDLEEQCFLNGYASAAKEGDLPDGAHLEWMKALCDGVSALWALEQIAVGRNPGTFAPFAERRMARAMERLT